MQATQRKNQNPKQRLLESSLRYLGYRARSKAEIETFLAKKTDDAQLLSEVLEELDSLRLINDDQFTADYISSRLRNRPKGEYFLKYELSRRFGIDKALVAKKIAEVGVQQWAKAASIVLSKKTKNLSKYSGQEFKAKAYYYLKSRGFSENIIAIAIDEYLQEK